jgi:hypothetical protein
MKIISHRGNLIGQNIEWENHPDYIKAAVSIGFDVEIDVWYISGTLFLGHDSPQYSINKNFLKDLPLWCHAKNIEALEYMINSNLHCFWHETDKVVLTSKNYLWTFKNNMLTSKSICVLPELQPDVSYDNAYGICTDYPVKYKNLL